MQNVLINLTADPSGLQPGIDGLVQMQVVDKDLADQVKQTNAELAKHGKTTSDSAKTAGNDLQKLSAQFQQLDKSIIGGQGGKAMIQVKAGVKGVADELLKLPKDPADNVSDSFKKSGEQVMRAQSQLRLYKSELARLAEDGKQGSPQFQDILEKATELEHALTNVNRQLELSASNTAPFQAIGQAFKGVISGFETYAGVIGLFSTDEKKAEEITKNLISIMAILNGVEEVGAVIAKNSALNQFILQTYRKLTAATAVTQAEATAALNTVETEGIAVTEGATVAQEGLNLAMSLNPAAIIFTAVAAIAGMLLVFSSNTEEATNEQRKLNEELKNELDYLDKLDKTLNTANDDRIKQLTSELALLQSKHVSQDLILKKELELKKAEGDKAISSAAFFADERENLKLNIADLELQRQKVKQLKDELVANGDNGFIKRLVTGTRSKDEIQNEIDAAEAGVGALEKKIELGQKAQDDLLTTTTETDAQANEIIRKAFEDGLKSARAYSESRVAIAKKGSQEELDAQVEVIRATAREQLLVNNNLTAGERIKIEREAQRQIADLTFNFQQKQAADDVKLTEAKATLEKEGSRERLNFELDALQKQKDAELQTSVVVNGQLVQLKDLSEKQKAEIEDRYLKLSSDKIRQFARVDAETQLGTRVAQLNANISKLSIDADSATNTVLLQQKKQLVDNQAQLEIISINDTVHNEEERRARVKEVYAKALLDKQQLERDKNKADIDNGLANANSVYDSLIAQQNRVLQNEKSTTAARRFAQDELFRFQSDKIDAEALANQQAYDAGVISFDEYLRKKRDLQSQQDDVDLSRELDHQARLNQVRDLASQTAVNFANVAFGIAQRGYSAEEERIKALYDQKRISETEYNSQLKVLRRKQAQDEKAQAEFTTLVNQGPTILKGFQQGGFAGVAAAFTLFFSLLAAVTGAQVPAFAKGKVKIDGPGTGTSDSIAARISKGESVINAASTAKHEAALRAINEDRYQQYLVQHERPKLYQNMSMTEVSEYVTTHTGPQIDYEKLGEVIAKKIADSPQHTISFDEDGFKYSMRKGNEVTEYKNKKLTI